MPFHAWKVSLISSMGDEQSCRGNAARPDLLIRCSTSPVDAQGLHLPYKNSSISESSAALLQALWCPGVPISLGAQLMTNAWPLQWPKMACGPAVASDIPFLTPLA
jgi:hypothetical protein